MEYVRVTKSVSGKADAGCINGLPYDGAKEMILADEVDDREFLCKLVESMWEELPEKKKRS